MNFAPAPPAPEALSERSSTALPSTEMRTSSSSPGSREEEDLSSRLATAFGWRVSEDWERGRALGRVTLHEGWKYQRRSDR